MVQGPRPLARTELLKYMAFKSARVDAAISMAGPIAEELLHEADPRIQQFEEAENHRRWQHDMAQLVEAAYRVDRSPRAIATYEIKGRRLALRVLRKQWRAVERLAQALEKSRRVYEGHIRTLVFVDTDGQVSNRCRGPG